LAPNDLILGVPGHVDKDGAVAGNTHHQVPVRSGVALSLTQLLGRDDGELTLQATQFEVRA
jgi:hypothetical protein